ILEDEEEAEDEAEDGVLEAAGVVLGVTLFTADEAQRRRAERRWQTRQYLVRAELLPNPRGQTAWQRLYQARKDRGFITTMGFDVETFDYILHSGFAETWMSTPIPRTDTSIQGGARPGAQSLDPAGGLGLVLHYLNSTMTEVSLEEIFVLIPSIVTRYINFCLEILLHTLRNAIPEAYLGWLQTPQEFNKCSDLIIRRHPRLSGAFASIDGLNLAVQTSKDEEIENATFNGWLHKHFISTVLVFSPLGTIIAARTNAPGSWHDTHVAQPIYEKLQTRTPEGYFLVADTAFPRGTGDIAGQIRAPVKAGQRVRGTDEEIAEAMAFDRELLSYRQTAEWGNRQLQGTFGRLRIPLDINNSHQRGDLLEICFRLANLRTRWIGINQITTVYM
ncbi:hypothetical protein GALMADRAFT_50277, partial [Galerina marginata CBS 339.88]